MKINYRCAHCHEINTVNVVEEIKNRLGGGFGLSGVMAGEFLDFSSSLLSNVMESSRGSQPSNIKHTCMHCNKENIVTLNT